LLFINIKDWKVIFKNIKDVFGMNLIQIAKDYSDFPKLRSPQVLINASTQSIPILLLTSYFGPVSAGFYTLSRSVINMPIRLIGKSVGDVFYPRISLAANNGESLTKLIKRAVLYLSIIGIIPFGIIFIYGPGIFGFVFGQEWVTAGEYARWLSIWLFFTFIYQPCIRALPVLSAQGLHLIYTVFVFGVNNISILLGFYLFKNDLFSIAIYSVSGGIVNLILIFITLNKSNKYDEMQRIE